MKGAGSDVVVGSWYSGVEVYDFQNPGTNPRSGSFTQTVWKNTKRIGCATSVLPNGRYIPRPLEIGGPTPTTLQPPSPKKMSGPKRKQLLSGAEALQPGLPFYFDGQSSTLCAQLLEETCGMQKSDQDYR